MPARFSGIRSPTARSLCSTVSWTALQNGKTLAMTSVGGASVASWTRIGHAPALIDRVRACVLDTPPRGCVHSSTLYIPLQTFLPKFMTVHYQLRIEINPYLLTHA